MHCKSLISDPSEARGSMANPAFCTLGLPDLGGLPWRCPATVRFSVRAWTEEGEAVVFPDISDGSVTPFAAFKNLYICDAQGTREPFPVTVCAIMIPKR